jgi:hypothetical protein
MAELTKEVIERVAAELQSRCHFKEIETSFRVAEAIIPLAQLPWGPPVAGEINAIFDTMRHVDFSTFAVVCEFVRRRNAVILPKPVDPRREAVRRVLWRAGTMSEEQKLDEILAALGEVK